MYGILKVLELLKSDNVHVEIVDCTMMHIADWNGLPIPKDGQVEYIGGTKEHLEELIQTKQGIIVFDGFADSMFKYGILSFVDQYKNQNWQFVLKN